MGKTVTGNKRKAKETKSSSGPLGTRSMSAAVRFAEMRQGKPIGVVQGKVFKAMLHTAPLNINEWAKVVYVSPRTLQNRIKENKAFDELQSDRVIFIMHVMDRGKEVFGDNEKFRRWLDAPRPTLDGKQPVHLLNDLVGIGEVLAELGRVEHGVF